jgi:hypothetical protein
MLTHAKRLEAQTVENTAIDFTRLFFMLYQGLDTQIALADTKAQLIMTANAILIASIAFSRGTFANVLNGVASPVDMITTATTLLMALFLVASVYFALLATRPRIVPPAVGTANLFFFGHIAHMDIDSYTDQFMGMSMQDIKRDVLAQIHAKSAIVERKFRSVRFSLLCLFAGLLLWILTRLILAL